MRTAIFFESYCIFRGKYLKHMIYMLLDNHTNVLYNHNNGLSLNQMYNFGCRTVFKVLPISEQLKFWHDAIMRDGELYEY